MRIRTFALAALVVAGCHWNLNDKGTEPETAQLYFPSGIATDPNGQFVYVSNGNADLRYGGGTVMMIDMLAFECTVARWRSQHPAGNDPTAPEYQNDVATKLPAGCAQYSSDEAYWDAWGEADRGRCQRDPLDPSIIDCDESGFILQNSTVKIGNFAGSIRIVQDADDPDHHRTLFVAVRGDPSITRIDVNFPGRAASLGGVAQTFMDPGILDCVSDPTSIARRPQYDPTTQKTSAPVSCEASFLIQDYQCQKQPTCLVGNDQFNKTQLPTEPFSMRVDASSKRLLVSHLASGQVSVIDVTKAAPEALLSESQPFFPPDATGRHGAFALAQQHPGDAHSTWYLTSNVNPQIATFRVGDSNIVIPQNSFGINASFAQGTDVRDIAFDVGGNRAFITENNPPSLIIMDTRPVDNSGGGNRNLITDIVNVCQTPSHMGVRRLAVAGVDGAPPSVKSKVVVVCFLSSQVMIVDPDRPGVDDTIFSGFAGPNDIAFNFSNVDDPQPIRQQAPRHAYVTNYSESTIAIVDLEPHSPTENRVIARLGFPLGGDAFNP